MRRSFVAILFELILLLICASRPLGAQEALPTWSVATGTGFVFRSGQGSFGINVRAARVIPVLPGLWVETGVTWQGYLSSDAWLDRSDFMFCVDPAAPCDPEPRRDGIGFAGVEVGAGYLKAGARNRLHPVGGVGIYRSTAHSTPTTNLGANLGVAYPLRESLTGPALQARYFRMFAHARFKSIVSLSLAWGF